MHYIFFYTRKKYVAPLTSLFLFYMAYLTYIYIVSFFHSIYFSYADYDNILKLILTFIFVFYFYFFLTKKQIFLLLRAFFYVGVFLAIINIFIFINGDFLIWHKIFIYRNASIFYDPNFYGAYSLFTLLFYYFYIFDKRRFLHICFLVFLLFNLIVTFSKASLLSFFITIF